MLQRTALGWCVIVLSVFSSDVLHSQPAPLTVLSKDATSLTRRTILTAMINEQEYVALDDLASMFQLNVREDALGALTVTYKNKTILLMADQPLASIAGRVVPLPVPPVRQGRRWLVPVDFIGRALAAVYDAKITLRRPSRLVIVGELRVPRVQVRYDASGPSSGRVTLDATPRAASTVTLDGDQLAVKFDADAIDVTYVTSVAAPLAAAAAQGLLQAVRVSDPVTLSFTTGAKFASFKATSHHGPSTSPTGCSRLSSPARSTPANRITGRTPTSRPTVTIGPASTVSISACGSRGASAGPRLPSGPSTTSSPLPPTRIPANACPSSCAQTLTKSTATARPP